MRRPIASFKSELEAAKSNLIRVSASLKFNDPEILPLALAIIDRWLDHADVERIWDTLKCKFQPGALTPQQLIQMVVERRIVARRLEAVVNQKQSVTKKLRHQAKRHRIEKRPAQSDATMSAVINFDNQSTNTLGRQKGQAPQKRFKLGWRQYFREQCGQPLDDVGAALTEIAFDTVVTRDQVRGAERATTSGGRLRRKPA
jgi:hypothetical protein